jgi:hypothetical protein
MSTWYSLSGSIRVLQCPEAGEIVRQLLARHGVEFNIETEVLGNGGQRITVCGCDEFSASEQAPDALLRALAPHALEAAVFEGVYDYDPVEIIVAPPGEAGRIAMSRLRLHQIEPLLRELVPGDRARFIERLQADQASGSVI